MKISVLLSDSSHPVRTHLDAWVAAQTREHDVELVFRKADLSGGELLFLVSCTEIVRNEDRARYGATLVLHASDLPRGRGWSPHIWDVVEGRDHLTLSLIEAADPVDSGDIWLQRRIPLKGTELYDDINRLLFDAEMQLMDEAVAGFGKIVPQKQRDEQASSRRRRTPEDSRLDPQRSLAEQFDLLRVCDPDRYPAFVEIRGARYHVTLERVDAADRKDAGEKS